MKVIDLLCDGRSSFVYDCEVQGGSFPDTGSCPLDLFCIYPISAIPQVLCCPVQLIYEGFKGALRW